jgi:hypothetical protein
MDLVRVVAGVRYTGHDTRLRRRKPFQLARGMLNLRGLHRGIQQQAATVIHRSSSGGGCIGVLQPALLDNFSDFRLIHRAPWRISTLQELTPAELQRTAIDTKKQLVEQYRAKLADPEFAKRQEARRAIVAAREARIAERKAAEQARRAREAAEKAAQEAAEQAASEAALQAELAARQAAAEAKATRERELQEALLSTRKERKAARKAKKRTGK